MGETGFFGDAELNSASTVPLRGPVFASRVARPRSVTIALRSMAVLIPPPWGCGEAIHVPRHLPAGAIRQSALKHLSDGRSSRPWRKHRPPFGALRV